MDFINKTVIVTGAAKGIGAACAELFYEKGANVCLFDVSKDESNVRDESWFYQQCDVSNEEQVKNSVSNLIQKYGSINFLINNAGIQPYGTVTETSLDEWNLVMSVNLTSMFLCAKYALPSMQENNSGVVINVASVQAFISQEKVAAYATAKAAILGLSRTIAIDYAPHIRCVAVCPGTVDTPLVRNAANLSPDPEAVIQECIDMHLLKRIAQPKEIAALIAFLCGDDAAFMTGQPIRIDGGLGIKVGGSIRD